MTRRPGRCVLGRGLSRSTSALPSRHRPASPAHGCREPRSRRRPEVDLSVQAVPALAGHYARDRVSLVTDQRRSHRDHRPEGGDGVPELELMPSLQAGLDRLPERLSELGQPVGGVDQVDAGRRGSRSVVGRRSLSRLRAASTRKVGPGFQRQYSPYDTRVESSLAYSVMAPSPATRPASGTPVRGQPRPSAGPAFAGPAGAYSVQE